MVQCTFPGQVRSGRPQIAIGPAGWMRMGQVSASERGGRMGLFTGKKGLILGVANEFSIAWKISKKLHEEGADLGFTHLPGDKMERRVRRVADPIGAKLVTPCDVQKD